MTQQAIDYTIARREILKLALMGLTPTQASRRVGVGVETARRWMLESGLDTSLAADGNLSCPACGGRMKKQELFFWQCSCGAEWWPSEDMIPDDVESWNLPCRLNVNEDVGRTIKTLLVENKTHEEIAVALNRMGLKTARGGDWSKVTVQKFILRNIKTNIKGERERIAEIVQNMVHHGYNCQQIAERLNAEGFKTIRGREWTMDNVLKFVRSVLKLDIKLLPIKRGAIPRIGKLRDDKEHPWRVAENAGAKAWKAKKAAEARRREHALHCLSGGHDAKG